MARSRFPPSCWAARADSFWPARSSAGAGRRRAPSVSAQSGPICSPSSPAPPRSKTIQDQVPTAAMRAGDFSASGITVNDPTTGAPFPNDKIPSTMINSVAAGFLALYPTPNAGNLNTPHAANYIVNRDYSVNSDQFDARIDHYLTSNMSVFGRFTWKDIGQAQPQDLLVPSENDSINYKLLATSWNWTIRPNLINEFRFG